MRNLQEATERICELKGSLMAVEALTAALLGTLPQAQRASLRAGLTRHAEVARTMLLHAPISEHTIAAFERDVARASARIGEPEAASSAVEPVLLTTVRISTFDGPRALTAASGFFFERGERLFLVTSRHVLIDEPTDHHPDRIEVELHADEVNLTRSSNLSILLFRDGLADWRQATDAGGPIDVAVIEVERSALPKGFRPRAFTPTHLQGALGEVEVGQALLVVGFPLGFHDTLHHLPVVRQAVIASSFGVRFQGRGYFLTDARTHRGMSGAPVLLRQESPAARDTALPWTVLGVHSSRLDMANRDREDDESLGLNCTWYADVLMALTEK